MLLIAELSAFSAVNSSFSNGVGAVDVVELSNVVVTSCSNVDDEGVVADAAVVMLFPCIDRGILEFEFVLDNPIIDDFPSSGAVLVVGVVVPVAAAAAAAADVAGEEDPTPRR